MTTPFSTRKGIFPSPSTLGEGWGGAAALILFLFFSLTISAQPAPQTTFQHPWYGKRIAYLGDSITDPRVLSKKDKWWTLLSQWLEATSYCYAISGRQWNDIPRQVNALLSEHGQDVDGILIFMGTNDYNSGTPLGRFYTLEEQPVVRGRNKQKYHEVQPRRVLCYNDTTYCGRINTALKALKETFPTKQIVILTPIHRATFVSGEFNVQPDETFPNRLGLFLDPYIDALKQVGSLWAVPVIDLHALSGLYPLMDEHAQYFSNAANDRLHPNDKGYERIARTLYYQLLTLPCTFEE